MTNSLLIKNIRTIAGINTGRLTCRRGHQADILPQCLDSWLIVKDGKFFDWGPASSMPTVSNCDYVIDAGGGAVIPSFCDSHTHLVYPGPRHGEFLDKINGLSYEQIAARGGGILNSADKLALMSEYNLFELAQERLRGIIATGTGAVEIKSGYGLSLDSELKMLRVIAMLAEKSPATVKATFLGAHAVGREYTGRQQDYVDHICACMLPAVAAEGLAEFVDVFCDKGFFTPQQTSMILEAAAKYGLRPKIHGNELAVSGGVEVAVAHGALSVDHLERAESPQFKLLAQSPTAATMLPQASFFLGMPYGNALKAIDSGCILALASDYNPGSAPSGSMPFVMSLACIKMKLTPEQALNATTINGAYAMDLSDKHGFIDRGVDANFIITRPLPAENPLACLPYEFTAPFVKKHFIRGVEQN